MVLLATQPLQFVLHVGSLITCVLIGRSLAHFLYRNHDYDPLKMRSPVFCFGLAWSLLLCIYTFNITKTSSPILYENTELAPENIHMELINKRISNPIVANRVKYIPPVIDSVILIDEDPIEEIVQKIKPIIDLSDEVDEHLVEEPSRVLAQPVPPTPPPLPIEPEVEDKDYVIVEEMPRFPACENNDITTIEKYKCAKQALMEYVYKTIRYPSSARDNGIEGMVVIQFVIDHNGAITKLEIKRDIGGGCGAEVERVMKTMVSDVGLWIPGRQQGRKVNVMFTLPVRFRLD